MGARHRLARQVFEVTAWSVRFRMSASQGKGAPSLAPLCLAGMGWWDLRYALRGASDLVNAVSDPTTVAKSVGTTMVAACP